MYTKGINQANTFLNYGTYIFLREFIMKHFWIERQKSKSFAIVFANKMTDGAKIVKNTFTREI